MAPAHAAADTRSAARAGAEGGTAQPKGSATGAEGAENRRGVAQRLASKGAVHIVVRTSKRTTISRCIGKACAQRVCGVLIDAVSKQILRSLYGP